MNHTRNPGGTPTGGQFARRSRAEIYLDLGVDGGTPGRDDTGPRSNQWDNDTHLALEAAAKARSSEELESAITHPNPYVRAEAAANVNLSAEQAHNLADDPDWCVRWQLSRRPSIGLTEKFSHDPDEVIRMQTLGDPELSEESRQRLLADPEVVLVMSRITVAEDAAGTPSSASSNPSDTEFGGAMNGRDRP